MYKKLLKKHYLLKIFVIAQPIKQGCVKTAFLFCKYLLKNTPYGNINIFIKELKKILNIFLYENKKLKCVFICSNKIFILNINSELTFKNIDITTKNSLKKVTFVFWYNFLNVLKVFSILKDFKLPSIGFMNYHKQPNITDYNLFLETSFFSSIFIFHFIFKKLLKNRC